MLPRRYRGHSIIASDAMKRLAYNNVRLILIGRAGGLIVDRQFVLSFGIRAFFVLVARFSVIVALFVLFTSFHYGDILLEPVRGQCSPLSGGDNRVFGCRIDRDCESSRMMLA